MKLQGLNAFSDRVTVDDRVTTRPYTAIIPVDRLITDAVLVATYDGGVTRNSNQIDTISMLDETLTACTGLKLTIFNGW